MARPTRDQSTTVARRCPEIRGVAIPEWSTPPVRSCADSTRRAVYRLILAVKSLTVLLAITLTASSCIFHKKPDTPGVVPEGAERLLNTKYPGWKPAAFASTDASCTTAAGSSPTVVNDDFNTDGFGDWALEIQTADSIKLVIVMGWLADFRAYEIESWPGDKVDRYLARAPRGTRYVNPLTKSPDYLGTNSLVATSCTGERAFYIWDGDGFRKVIPGTAAAPKRD